MHVLTRNGRSIGLTYCSNVHPAESADDVIAVVRGPMRRVFEGLAGAGRKGPFGAGLRLSAAAAFSLRDDAFQVEELGQALLDLDAHALTVNAFPFGGFHGRPVKSDVYRPDWTSDARVDYTLAVAEVLASLPTAAARPSISTSPGSFKSFGPADPDEIAERIAHAAAELYMLDMQYEKTITLAIEPEPGCTFARIDEWIAFMKDVLLAKPRRALERLKPGNRAFQEEILRRHVTLCLDACHLAVEYDDPETVFGRLAAEGFSIGKIQLSNALEIDHPRPGTPAFERLRTFDEPVYLHQTTAVDEAGVRESFDDLPAFFARAETKSFRSARVHFHVPIFTESFGALGSTAAALRAVIDTNDRTGACDQLEIETYSWGVLPERTAKDGEDRLAEDIVREYQWAIDRLTKKREPDAERA